MNVLCLNILNNSSIHLIKENKHIDKEIYLQILYKHHEIGGFDGNEVIQIKFANHKCQKLKHRNYSDPDKREESFTMHGISKERVNEYRHNTNIQKKVSRDYHFAALNKQFKLLQIGDNNNNNNNNNNNIIHFAERKEEKKEENIIINKKRKFISSSDYEYDNVARIIIIKSCIEINIFTQKQDDHDDIDKFKIPCIGEYKLYDETIIFLKIIENIIFENNIKSSNLSIFTLISPTIHQLKRKQNDTNWYHILEDIQSINLMMDGGITMILSDMIRYGDDYKNEALNIWLNIPLKNKISSIASIIDALLEFQLIDDDPMDILKVDGLGSYPIHFNEYAAELKTKKLDENTLNIKTLQRGYIDSKYLKNIINHNKLNDSCKLHFVYILFQNMAKYSKKQKMAENYFGPNIKYNIIRNPVRRQMESIKKCVECILDMILAINRNDDIEPFWRLKRVQSICYGIMKMHDIYNINDIKYDHFITDLEQQMIPLIGSCCCDDNDAQTITMEQSISVAFNVINNNINNQCMSNIKQISIESMLNILAYSYQKQYIYIMEKILYEFDILLKTGNKNWSINKENTQKLGIVITKIWINKLKKPHRDWYNIMKNIYNLIFSFVRDQNDINISKQVLIGNGLQYIPQQNDDEMIVLTAQSILNQYAAIFDKKENYENHYKL